MLRDVTPIQAAPAWVQVFVGYPHPFKTQPQHYGQAVEIFSFTDYERELGGLFDVDWLGDDVGRAAFQFFANGGAVAWVVALKPQFHDLSGGPTTDVTPPALLVDTSSTGIVFTGREPVGAQHPLTISITKLRPTPRKTPLDPPRNTLRYRRPAPTVPRGSPQPHPA